VINTFYDSWLMEFLSILYENDKMARPTSANALDLFNKLLVSSNKAAIINNFKINRNKEILREEISRHTIFSIFMTIGLIFSTFLEYYFTTLIFSDIIINFV
jgi:hypothetical protein